MQEFGDKKAAMKLTWFGGTTVRIHTGGLILVLDPETAPAKIDRAELASGADRIIVPPDLPPVDLVSWRPRKVGRLIDDVGAPAAEIWSSESGAILVDAAAEPPLLLFPVTKPDLGRWAQTAIIVISGDGERLVKLGEALLAEHPPRLLALAGNDAAIDYAVPRLRHCLDGSGLVALEPHMALEV